MTRFSRWCSLAAAVGTLFATSISLDAKTVTLHEGDSGNRVALNPGDTLVIHVSEPAPHSRQSWRLAEYDSAVLRPNSREGQIVRNQGRSERQFAFHATGRGVSDIVLTLDRRGFLSRGVASTFRAQVRVGSVGPGPAPMPSGRQVVVSEKQDHSHLRLLRGDILVVRLNAKGPRSHRWVPVRQASEVLRPAGPPRAIKGKDGGQTEFRYEVVGSGRAQLAFSFQNDSLRGRDDERRNFEVTVEASRGGFPAGGGRPRR